MLIVATAMIMTLLYLPAVIELKNPSDAGPRLVSDKLQNVGLLKGLFDIEGYEPFFCPLNQRISTLSNFYNLE